MRKLFLTIVALLMMTATVFAEEYTSNAFGYSLNVPVKPLAVVMNPSFDTSRRGEMLVFENEGIHVKYGFIITVDAFNTNAVPDFNKDKDNIIVAYIDKLKNSGAYERVEFTNLTKGNRAIIAYTAREVEVDEDGDGKIDGVATADSQQVIAFFRTPGNHCWSVQLLNDVINAKTVDEFKNSLATFRDLTYVEVDPKAQRAKERSEAKALRDQEKAAREKEKLAQKAAREKEKSAQKAEREAAKAAKKK